MNASSWQLSVASTEDDAALCKLLRETPLSGNITTTLEREPSFFGADVDVTHRAVTIARKDGVIAACGSRIVRRAWWENETVDAAYLADLRVHLDHQRRAGRLLVQGYRHLEEQAASHPAAVTWTAIFENNHRARQTLDGRHRPLLPGYRDRGRLLCPAILVPRRAKFPKADEIRWEVGTTETFEEITAFLTQVQKHRPLAPVHTSEDFAEGQRWPHLKAADFILARRGQNLAGVVAVWDQRSFRQVRIKKLSAQLRFVRPFWNGVARLLGWPALPSDNSVLPMAHAAFLAVEHDSPELARALIQAARATAATRGIGWLCICLHERDPLAACLKGFPAIPSHGRLYQVSREASFWPESAAPIIESATL